MIVSFRATSLKTYKYYPTGADDSQIRWRTLSIIHTNVHTRHFVLYPNFGMMFRLMAEISQIFLWQIYPFKTPIVLISQSLNLYLHGHISYNYGWNFTFRIYL